MNYMKLVVFSSLPSVGNLLSKVFAVFHGWEKYEASSNIRDNKYQIVDFNFMWIDLLQTK